MFLWRLNCEMDQDKTRPGFCAEIEKSFGHILRDIENFWLS